MQTNYKILATAGTLENINKLVNEYFYSNITLKENKNILTGNKGVFFELFNSKGKINNFTILQDKKYQFLIKQH